MSKKRVLEWGMQRRGFVTVDDEATPGAVLGQNLYNADGTLVTLDQIVEEVVEVTDPPGSTPGIVATIWRYILEIPLYVKALSIKGPDFTYNVGGDLVQIDYDDGEQKLFTYTAGDLTRVDFIQNGNTLRKDLFYSGGDLDYIDEYYI